LKPSATSLDCASDWVKPRSPDPADDEDVSVLVNLGCPCWSAYGTGTDRSVLIWINVSKADIHPAQIVAAAVMVPGKSAGLA
jgi:hypothetical protein